MKAIQRLSIILFIILGLSACAVQPTSKIVVIKKQRPTKVILVNHSHRRNHVLVVKR